jgi:hypothetical protein
MTSLSKLALEAMLAEVLNVTNLYSVCPQER